MACAPADPHAIDASDARALRERLGDSRLEFALRLGVSASTIENWERGTYEPSWRLREAVHDLCEQVGCPNGGEA